eukprot:TRINITY_DN20803_c0_g1_i1.p1 TRINITY_DN20803_c0_g1~~TRINITY_DN20803_c0_g1_i1.p1  ORF type:complete len:380 (-),score=34.84 TRINITY_DN20803_c0_g1_i1:29-1099(-)
MLRFGQACWHWLLLRVALLLAYSVLLRVVENFVSAILLGACFWLWQCYDAQLVARREAAALWTRFALPLRVAAFAEQLGVQAKPGSAKAWGPAWTWTPESASVAAVVNPDFSDAQAVQRFDSVRHRVQCVFASKAHLWGNDWSEEACGARGDSSPEALLSANVSRCMPRLLRFCLEVRRGAPLDGFVFEVRGSAYGADLVSFSRTVRRVLTTLSAGDPTGADCMRRGSIDRKSWYFQFAREPLFVTTFAPCYPSSNPRYQFGQVPDSCFVLLQPEESFLRHDLPADKPRSATNWDSPSDVRDRIRSNFRRHGREYRIPETTSYPPAEFIVPPLDALRSPPVQFWREAATAGEGAAS